MLESINLESNVAVFAQIENEVRFAIASGVLKAGDRLPTVRAVAEKLDINPNTVAKAYRDLEIMGLVYTRRGMGIFIKDGVEEKCQQECYREIVGKMHEVVAEAKAAGMKEADVKALAKKCFASDATPYDTPPESILALC
jgi:GntR family transcriptional regulator